MKRRLILLAVAAAVIAPLVALGGGGSDDRADLIVVTSPTRLFQPPPVRSSSRPLESLGAGAAAIYRTPANAEPRDPVEGDIVPIDFTAEPVEVAGT